MEYKIGEIVYHNLTNEEFLIIEFLVGLKYVCRGKDYQKHTFNQEELIGKNPN